MTSKQIYEKAAKYNLILCFSGSTAVGKTTLSTKLAENIPGLEYVKELTRNVKPEDRLKTEGQDKILENYIKRLSNLAEDGFICDRTLYDVCAYSIVSKSWDTAKVRQVCKLYKSCKFYPDFIFYVPIEFDPEMDSDQANFLGIRKEIDEALLDLLEEWHPDFITLRGTVQERSQTIFKELAKIN